MFRECHEVPHELIPHLLVLPASLLSLYHLLELPWIGLTDDPVESVDPNRPFLCTVTEEVIITAHCVQLELVVPVLSQILLFFVHHTASKEVALDMLDVAVRDLTRQRLLASFVHKHLEYLVLMICHHDPVEDALDFSEKSLYLAQLLNRPCNSSSVVLKVS